MPISAVCALELVALAPDVILANGSTIFSPIAADDSPAGIADHVREHPRSGQRGGRQSLAQPGGNATGFTSFSVRHQREMAGTAEKEFARTKACGRHSRSRFRCWRW